MLDRSALTLTLTLALACSPTPVTSDAGTSDPGTTIIGTGDTSAGDTSTGVPETGTTASPTTGGPTGPGFCTPTCEQEGQLCRIDGYGTDDYFCIEGVCRFSACTSDKVCNSRAAKWGGACRDDFTCAQSDYACVSFEGEGRCAPLEDDMISCADIGLIALDLMLFEGESTVTVCAETAARCIDKSCFFPCKFDADCPADQGRPHCDVDSGICRCNDDAECLASGTPGLVACVAGLCACNVDADCAGGKNVDICIDGTCGCSSTATCNVPVFDTAVLVCAPGD